MDILLFASSSAMFVYWKRRRRIISSSSSFRPRDATEEELRSRLEQGSTLNADERICIVNENNKEVGGDVRANMRLYNLWHRATYILILHEDEGEQQENTPTTAGPSLAANDSTKKGTNDLAHRFVLVQRRSSQKDYCPLKLDPLPGGVVGYGESYRDNAIRELQEEMNIKVAVNNNNNNNVLTRLFTFPYEDERVRVWGEVYECHYHGSMDDLVLQEEEVEDVMRISLEELKDLLDTNPQEFMPDACYAMKLYFQRLGDLQVQRRLLKGYSSGALDSYKLRPKPRVVFFDCDDCLYFDGWKTANHLTRKIDEWCIRHGLQKGQAYELYKKYGTALRGLLAEGYVSNTEEAIDGFLQEVHDIPVHELLQPDEGLRQMLLRMDPDIPKFIFTASVKDHAVRCLKALGIADLFEDIIDCKACNLETKHSQYAFETAMKVANIDNPEQCLFFDDNLKNISAARKIGWRSVLVGTVGRDCGRPVSSEHAELEIDRIHHAQDVLPELFGSAESM